MPRPAPTPLEPSDAEWRDLLARTGDRIAQFYAGLPSAPTHQLDRAQKLVAALREPLPERGLPYRRLLGQLFERAIPISLNTASPGYLAYIPGGGLPTAAIAELITASTNRYVGIWQGAPGLVQIEISVIRWLCDLAGFPAEAGGLLTTGGSLATLIGLVTARRARLPQDFLAGTIYTSSQAHHSVHKAARFAGFPDDAVRTVPVDAGYRMDVAALQAQVDADRAAGRQPFLVVSAAGTTATGAVDPLPALAALCARERLWHHVDAAYGGAFLLTERGQAALRGISTADSITLDPHKGLFLPYGTGALLVRDLATLRAAHQVRANYLPDAETDPHAWDFADLGPELSREPRGLRVWLPLKMHGAEAFRAALNEKLDLAQWAAEQVAALPGVTLVAPPSLSLFAFRANAPPGVNPDRYNRAWMSRTNARQRVFLSGVDLDDGFALRVCVLCFRTHQDRMQMLVEDLGAALGELGSTINR